MVLNQAKNLQLTFTSLIYHRQHISALRSLSLPFRFSEMKRCVIFIPRNSRPSPITQFFYTFKFEWSLYLLPLLTFETSAFCPQTMCVVANCSYKKELLCACSTLTVLQAIYIAPQTSLCNIRNNFLMRKNTPLFTEVTISKGGS